ncbi:MAG: class I fructose-bisphosphate aldolase [Candidatus Magasanikbacteria bacterium]
MNSLTRIAEKLVAKDKGILASDESTSTATDRLNSIGVESTKEMRRQWRQFLYATDGIEKYISGVIMFDETIRQDSDSGDPLPEVLSKKGIIPGIKVDKGKIPIPFSEEEKVTEGLDGLRGRLEEYKEMGAKFAKWRGALYINEQKHLPSDYSIHLNAHALARYAALCQDSQVMPIVEPEVVMEGNHSIERCYEATKKTLQAVFKELEQQKVDFSEILLKPNMVISGSEADDQSEPSEVAEYTIKCLEETVPEEVPGIVFLSGGQTPERATKNLNEINKKKPNPDWELSFSYGRALQREALEAWKGKTNNVEEAQKTFLNRAQKISQARRGQLN